MNFSIIIPTRGRPKKIQRLLDSILATTAQIDKIEIIFRVDSDDHKTISTLEKIKAKTKCKLKLVKLKRSEFISDLWEDCLPVATGDRLFMCADDVIFRTKNWDKLIIDKTPGADKKIYFAWGNDKNQGRGLATLPILSRGWVDAVGYFVPRGYKRDYCDTHLQDIAVRLKKLGSDRMLYFGNVVFEHMHPTVGKADWDDTYRYRLKMGVKEKHPGAHTYSARANERQELAKKLHKKLS